MPYKARFHRNPVQSVCRPLRNTELRLLQDFEEHIARTHTCRRYLQECAFGEGCSYCRRLISYIISRLEHQHGRYIYKKSHDFVLMFVEIPRYLLATRWTLYYNIQAPRQPLRIDHKGLYSVAPNDMIGEAMVPHGIPLHYPDNPTYRRSFRGELGAGFHGDNFFLSFSRLVISQGQIHREDFFRATTIERQYL